jgi:hypothetical protein
LFFNGDSIDGKGQDAQLDWRQVCIARGKIIKSDRFSLWVAGHEVRPGDYIVEFHAMRDEQDEYVSVVICRPPHRKSRRMDIVDQATLLTDVEAYDKLYKTEFRQPRSPEAISKLERNYLSSRMLFAWRCKDRMTVYLRPLDLIRLVMVRGHVVDRFRYPILSTNSDCYVEIDEEDKAEAGNRTYTVTM